MIKRKQIIIGILIMAVIVASALVSISALEHRLFASTNSGMVVKESKADNVADPTKYRDPNQMAKAPVSGEKCDDGPGLLPYWPANNPILWHPCRTNAK
jgi:hypothetical protein